MFMAFASIADLENKKQMIKMLFETNLIDLSLCTKSGDNIITIAKKTKLSNYVNHFIKFKSETLIYLKCPVYKPILRKRKTRDYQQENIHDESVVINTFSNLTINKRSTIEESKENK